MKVVVGAETSSEATVDFGVPQRTVLGLVLFLCHVNELPEAVTSQVRLNADDCLLYHRLQSMSHQL